MWKNKNVWILLSGEFIAGLGLWLGIIGNLEFMQEKVPSDFMKSLILASGLLAGLAVGPYAGKLIDRMKKKTVMLAAGFIRMVSVVFMLIAIHTGSVLWMVVFLMVIQLSAAFYFPALQAAIPMVVKGKELLKMNGVHMNVSTLSRILGTALGGVLLVIMPLYMLYILSLLAYAILFGLTWFLSFQEEEATTGAKGKSGGFKEVFPVLKNLPIVSMTLIMTLIPLLFIGGFNLMVINISEIQDSTAIKGWIYTAEGLSFMVGAFAVKRIGEKISPYRILFTFSFIIGIAQLVLYFAGNPVLSVLSFIIFGFAVGCFFPTAATIFQTRMPKDYHGRFFSFRNMLDRMAFQVVLLMTGLLLDLVGLPVMTVLFGGFSLIMTTIFYVRFKALQEKKTHVINV
ncbi:MFS transporter [Rossellomorea marisflavi]|uniref:MFS transporter n=1 Tax=Rossellomorea marisflavi TaxID=189381 RepID=UPI0034596254